MSLNAFSYVRTKTDSGKDIYWSISGNEIPFYIYSNPSNSGATYSIDSLTSDNIILNTVNAWNAESPLKLNPQIVSNLSSITDPKVGTISYSSNPMYFGEGVLAITRVRFNSNTGTISGGDILINDSFMNLTSITSSAALSSNGSAYLG